MNFLRIECKIPTIFSMKTLKKLHPVLVIFLFICSNFAGFAQDTTNVSDQQKRTFIVTKNDGTEYVGVLISQDEREVLLETKSIGRLYIPKHEIKCVIKEIKMHKFFLDDAELFNFILRKNDKNE